MYDDFGFFVGNGAGKFGMFVGTSSSTTPYQVTNSLGALNTFSFTATVRDDATGSMATYLNGSQGSAVGPLPSSYQGIKYGGSPDVSSNIGGSEVGGYGLIGDVSMLVVLPSVMPAPEIAQFSALFASGPLAPTAVAPSPPPPWPPSNPPPAVALSGFPLDSISGYTLNAAYGIQRLRAGYTGALVNLQLSKNGVTADFFATATNQGLQTSGGVALATWLGGGTATVTSWCAGYYVGLHPLSLRKRW